MKISKDRFDAWVESVWDKSSGNYSPSRVAKVAGISRTSLYYQRNKGYVEASVIIAVSRGLSLKPLNELLKFPEFGIFTEFRTPQAYEVLSQLPLECLMEELTARLRHEEVEHYPHAMPEPYGLKRWMDANALYGHYAELAEAMGLSSVQALSSKINENRLTLGQLVAMCKQAQLNGRFGLVVTGMMSWEEVGYPWNIREDVLGSASGTTVVDALKAAHTWLERAIRVKEIEGGVHQDLG